MNQNQRRCVFTVGILGPSGVGKTSIASRFLYNKFYEEHKKTFQEFYRAEMTTNDCSMYFNIIDAADHSGSSAMNTLAIQHCDAFVLVFALTDIQSFEKVGLLQEEITSLRGDIPIFIIRNKADIDTEFTALDKTTLESIVCIDWNCRYMEVSAKESTNIAQLFDAILTTRSPSPSVLTKIRKQKNIKNSCMIS